MDTKELLKLLDLDGDPPDPPAGPGILAPAPDKASPADLSPTALAVDAWGLRRGRDLAAESDRLKAAGIDDYAAADFFWAAFDPDPRLLVDCVDPRRHRFLAHLFDTPGYRLLHTATRLDDTAAGIAAAHFAGQFAAIPGDPAEAAPAADVRGEIAAVRAAGRAVADAGKEVDELREFAAAFGLGPGSPGSTDPAAIAALYRRVRTDPSLGRVCDLAGRFRRVAQSKQRMKGVYGRDDMVGVEPGGDVGRLLPVELARLMVPELELDALRRIAERQALCREYSAAEPAGKGPVIVSVDESGSMQGTKVETAKALALAVAWVARRQRRWVGLVAYSGDTGERLLALLPGRWDEHALADWVSAFLGRGSSLDVPVREMPDYYRRLGAPAGVTDILFVTDAVCRIPADMAARFNAWRRSVKARVVSLVVGSDPGDLSAVSDECHRVAELAPDAAAVGRVLSL